MNTQGQIYLSLYYNHKTTKRRADKHSCPERDSEPQPALISAQFT